MIKNVVFDIGMVLVDFNWRGVMANLGFTEEETEKVGGVILSELWNDLDRGVMPEKEVTDMMKKQIPGYEEKFDMFWKYLYDTIEIFPYSVEWVKSMKDRGYNTYLLSNFPQGFYQNSEEHYFDFMPYIDGKIISSHVKCIKPEAEIYEKLLQTYDLKAEECVFFDDRADNVAGAKAVGINAIHFTDFEEAKTQFEELVRSME